MKWAVRKASLRDLPALTTLCKVSAGPDDYAIDYLEPTILRDVLHVALDRKAQIVGMGSYRECFDGSAWLGMARTHPDHRREGVARAILDSFIALAGSSARTPLRLWSDASNRDGTGLALAAGFTAVGRFTRVVAPAARGVPKGTPRGFDEALWALVHTSPIVARGKGYASHGWVFVPATRPVVSAIAAQGAFLGWGDNVIAVTDPDPRMPLEFTLWAGNPEELFPEGCRRAAARGRTETATFVPHDRDLLSEARRAGFQEDAWGREAVLYELAVPAAGVKECPQRAPASGGNGRRPTERPTPRPHARKRESRGRTRASPRTGG